MDYPISMRSRTLSLVRITILLALGASCTRRTEAVPNNPPAMPDTCSWCAGCVEQLRAAARDALIDSPEIKIGDLVLRPRRVDLRGSCAGTKKMICSHA